MTGSKPSQAKPSQAKLAHTFLSKGGRDRPLGQPSLSTCLLVYLSACV
eukprot:COSAG06_NODE_416_length_15996_cov_260.778637_2_plen_48_part_00